MKALMVDPQQIEHRGPTMQAIAHFISEPERTSHSFGRRFEMILIQQALLRQNTQHGEVCVEDSTQAP